LPQSGEYAPGASFVPQIAASAKTSLSDSDSRLGELILDSLANQPRLGFSGDDMKNIWLTLVSLVV